VSPRCWWLRGSWAWPLPRHRRPLSWAPRAGVGRGRDASGLLGARWYAQPEQVVVAARLTEEEIFARLVCAEGVSTNWGQDPTCTRQAHAILHAIAWGVMNRVRLGQTRAALHTKYGASLREVVFKAGQFNPAVATRSRFAPVLLCPTAHPAWAQYWPTTLAAVWQAQQTPARNPFLLTAWEKRTGLSLVTHFSYPLSVQVPPPPAWAATSARATTLVRDVTVCGTQLHTACIWFFRLEQAW
jgi:hypothetical protein